MSNACWASCYVTLGFAVLSLTLCVSGPQQRSFPRAQSGSAWLAAGHHVSVRLSRDCLSHPSRGPNAERHRKGSKKGQDNGPFVSMETAPWGEGLKERKLLLHLHQDLGNGLFCGWTHPSPSLPDVHHGNPASKQEVQSSSRIWCWGNQGAKGKWDWASRAP